jgi:capsular exopolysaccharide synthesis family protein
VDRSVGLVDVLAGTADLNHVLQPWGNTGLFVLPSGSIPPNPSELLGSRNMRALLATLRESFEFVVIDTPPVLPVTDAAVASTVADGVVFVVSYGRTKRAQVASAFEQLEAVGGRVIGTVFNMSPTKRKSGYGSYGDYSAYETTMTPSAVVDVNADLATSAPNGRLRKDAARGDRPAGVTGTGAGVTGQGSGTD